MAQLNALSPVTDINAVVGLVNKHGAGAVNPEVFYSKQLLDTIRLDASAYVYYRMADEAPIEGKADKLMLRRWAPLQAHTTPLAEGIPPKSDMASMEKYEITAKQYGRFMEFSDKVDFQVVDPIIAHYTKEYSLVAMETLDMLAREELLSKANKFYAKLRKNFEALTIGDKPSLADLRLISLSLKKQLVKPRSNGRYHVIGSPDFYNDMVDDPIVEKYMTINQTTKTMYDNSKLVPLFDLEFYETPAVPTSAEFYNASGKRCLRVYRATAPGVYEYATITEDDTSTTSSGTKYLSVAPGYRLDSRTKKDASYDPAITKWNLELYNTDKTATANPWRPFLAQHILVLGKDALTRTGIAGEGNAKMYVKQKGSSGVLDPIDQRQSIGFKINSVGFGSTRLEAIVDYICVPSQTNLL